MKQQLYSKTLPPQVHRHIHFTPVGNYTVLETRRQRMRQLKVTYELKKWTLLQIILSQILERQRQPIIGIMTSYVVLRKWITCYILAKKRITCYIASKVVSFFGGNDHKGSHIALKQKKAWMLEYISEGSKNISNLTVDLLQLRSHGEASGHGCRRQKYVAETVSGGFDEGFRVRGMRKQVRVWQKEYLEMTLGKTTQHWEERRCCMLI